MRQELTYQSMCETIEKSGLLQYKNGQKPTATEIFNYSPTGELFQIPFWYPEALMRLGRTIEAESIYAAWDDEIAEMATQREAKRRMGEWDNG